MAKKCCCSECESKIAYWEAKLRDSRNQEGDQEWAKERKLPSNKRFVDKRKSIEISDKKLGGCKCDKQKSVEISESSELEDSVQGLGFVDLYRQRHQQKPHYEPVDASELYSIDHRGQGNKIPNKNPCKWEPFAKPFKFKDYKPRPSEETLAPLNLNQHSGSVSPLPLNKSYLRSIFRSPGPEEPRQSRPMGRVHKWTRLDRQFLRDNGVPIPSPKLTERSPFQTRYGPKSSTQFSPRFHPRQTIPSESSDACLARCSKKSTEKESEQFLEPPTELIDPSESRVHCCDDSLDDEIVCNSGKNCEVDYRNTRMQGGALNLCPWMRKPVQSRYKMGSSSRIHFKPKSECAEPNTLTKRSSFKWKVFSRKPQVGEDPLLETLLSSRSLVYSHSSGSQRQGQDPTSFSTTTLDMPASESCLALDLTLELASSRPSGMKPDYCCSRGLRLPSLDSNYTFTKIWRAAHYGSATSPTGGLYSQVDKLKFRTIDRLDAGFSMVPLFEGSKEETRERVRYFAIEFDMLSTEERLKDTELRFRQLRKLQDTSDKTYRKYYQDHKPVPRPVPINGTLYCCPIGGMCCPPVTNETILGHKMRYHLHERGLELREIFSGDRLLLIFNPRSYALGRNSCMSAMAYAGVYNDPSTLPGRRFMPTRNRQLPCAFAQYSEHLPLFVMVCRNRWSTVEGGRKGYSEWSTECLSERNDVLTFWVVTVDLALPVHVIMTVLNRRMDATRSCVMKARPLHKTQNCLKIMRSSTHYMQLCEQDLRILTSDDTEPIYLEISVKEFSGTLECKPPLEVKKT